MSQTRIEFTELLGRRVRMGPWEDQKISTYRKILEALDECTRIAAAAGYPPRDKHLERSRAMLTERGSGFAASMLRDVQAGGRTEADHVIGDLLARARALGVAAPLLRVALCHLQTYEAGRGR